MSKYGDWTRGEDEALLNKIGGSDEARLVLRGQKMIQVRWPSEVLAPDIIMKWGMVVRYEDPPRLPHDFKPWFHDLVHPFSSSAEVIDGDDVSRRAEDFGCRLRVCDGQFMLENAQSLPEYWRRYSFPLVGTVLEKKGMLYYMSLSYYPLYSGYWAMDPIPVSSKSAWNPGNIVFLDRLV